MELHRFTGALTGLVLSGGIALYFFFLSNFASITPKAVDVTVFYLLVPPMVVGGFVFDIKSLWNKLFQYSKLLRPSFIGSGFFWLVMWPVVKLMNDLLNGGYLLLKTGEFVLPSYFSSFGFHGLFGYFLYQAMVGTGMGLMFFMAYRPVFGFLTRVRKRLGMKDDEYEMTFQEELTEFGFRK